MKIFVVNAGSSSLKYQLIDMDNESVLAKGLRRAVIFPNRRAVRKNRQLGEAYILPRKTRNKEGLR